MRKFLFFILVSLNLSWGTQIEGVPFVKQKDEYCGPASLSSVLMFYGYHISQEEIAKEVYIPKLKGVLVTDLENFSKKLGFNTVLKSSTIEDIKKFLDERKPIIALIDMGFWILSKPHYIVVLGYNDKGFIVHTGYEPKKLIDYREFEERWKKLGSIVLVVYR
ncbi:MAG: C39 family peptidase [Hydrogenothermaceae bacterium]|nr:C39 family peptidase [Hydrogenothermaceae bacterium]